MQRIARALHGIADGWRDTALELRITCYRELMMRKGASQKRVIFWQQKFLGAIRARSARQVERMERERGLWSDFRSPVARGSRARNARQR